MLDGLLARRFGLATQAGAVADALADKFVQVALVAFFTFAGGPPFAEIPLWFFGLVLGRDLALGAGWVAVRSLNVTFPVVHRLHGRAATVGVFAVLFWITVGLEGEGFVALMFLTAALIWVSVGSYAARAWMAWRGPVKPLVTPPSEGGST